MLNMINTYFVRHFEVAQTSNQPVSGLNVESARAELLEGDQTTNSAPTNFGTRWTRHPLNSAHVKPDIYTFKSMFKQYYILNVVTHSL